MKDLIKTVEPLTHRERGQQLALCRHLADTPELAELLSELSGLGYYERCLGLRIAVATRDRASLAYLAARTTDPDADLAIRAIALSVRLGAEVGHLVDQAPRGVRTALYQAIRTHRRTALADELIDRVRTRWGDAEAAILLPGCGAEQAARLLPELAHAVRNWPVLARRHPGAVLDQAERELAELPRGQFTTWWHERGAGIAATVDHDPLRVLRLLELSWTGGPADRLVSHRIGTLIAADPARAVALLTRPEHRSQLTELVGRRAVRRQLVRAGGVHRVARAVREDTSALVSLLGAVPPSEREAVFDAAMDGVDLSTAVLDPELLDVLPHARRVREAERMSRLRAVTDQPLRLATVVSALPYEQSAPRLRELTRSTDSADRALGYRLLVRCAGRTRDPEALTSLFADLDRLAGEQEPVRLVVLNALARLPAEQLRPEHVPALTGLVRDALAARDCSASILGALAELAGKLAARGLVEFTLDTLAAVAGHGGPVDLGRLDQVLPRGQEHALVDRLGRYLDAEQARGEYDLLFALVESLGRRAHGMPRLQDGLAQAVQAKRDSVVRRAVTHWLAPAGTRAERVAEVLTRERSAVTVPEVFDVIAHSRTDLLYLGLSGRPPGGRFWDRKVIYVPSAPRSRLRRWTGMQRAAYVELQHLHAGGESAPDRQRARAVLAIGEVPGAGAEQVGRYLGCANEVVRRAALTAAGRTTRPQEVLADLLASTEGPDAHVAVYCVTRAARHISPDRLGGTVAPLLAARGVGVRKQAVRLLAHNRVPGAVDLLASAWGAHGQHEHVLGTIAASCLELLEDPAARHILSEASTMQGSVAVRAVNRQPLRIAPGWREWYAGIVARVADSADPHARDRATLRLADWTPWAPGAARLLARRVTDLSTTDRWRGAVLGLLACAEPELLQSTVDSLRGAPPSPDAERERDLPARQRLDLLVTRMIQLAEWDRAGAADAIAALDEVLPEPLAARLHAATLDWHEPDVDRLAARELGGALATAEVAEALAHSTNEVDPALVLPHAQRLAERVDRAGGLFARALAARCGPRAGWSPPWRAVLRQLRAHPDQDVARLAQHTWTAGE
ncbi:hypothetical protein GCM10010174_24740 [Kutzneria viridogrisea]|uniref:HEAT repeat protein n=1 Tax=Kutzneria viridogrisea TaxID=47990 RepID=A0ABR6BQ03_9PSEU|nr:hypothetical protein [Kutzneria viridogrisea]